MLYVATNKMLVFSLVLVTKVRIDNKQLLSKCLGKGSDYDNNKTSGF